MKKIFLLSLLAAFLVSGCANRMVTGLGLSAAGGVLGNQLSDGDPTVTAIGAGAGFLANEILNGQSEKKTLAAFQSGYDHGRSDAVKQQYWMMVNQQKAGEQTEEDLTLYEIPLPEQKIDGVILEPTTRILPIQE